MTDSSSSSTTSSTVNSILETSLRLCRCIEEILLVTPDSDGTLDWDLITAKMKATGGTNMSKSELQIVWKYIAYGRKPLDMESTICDSDGEEPFHQPFSAVKRFRTFTTAQSSKPKDGASVSQEQHCLSSTIPSTMKADVLGRNIKIDIPKHVVQGLVGVQPPIYLSAAETMPVPRAQSKPLRVARVTHLVAQENESFANALMPVAVHGSYSRPTAGLSAYPLLGLPPGTAPRPVAPTYAPTGGASSSSSSSSRPPTSAYQTMVGAKTAVPIQHPVGGVKPAGPPQVPAGFKSTVGSGSAHPVSSAASGNSAAKPVAAASAAVAASAPRWVPATVGIKRPAPVAVTAAAAAPGVGATQDPARPPVPGPATYAATAPSSSSSSSSGAGSTTPNFAHPLPSGMNILPASAPVGAGLQGSGLPPAGMQRAGASSAVITRPNVAPGQRALFVAPGGPVPPAVANLRKLPNASFPATYIPRGYAQPPVQPAAFMSANPYSVSVPIMHAEAALSAAAPLPVPAGQQTAPLVPATEPMGEISSLEETAPRPVPSGP